MPDEVSSIIEQIKIEQDFFKKATLLEYLKIQKKVRIKDLSRLLNMKAAYICHILRLNKLPDIIKDGYYSKMVSVSHLFIIARLNSHADMLTAYEAVLGGNMTALQTDELIRSLLYKVTSDGQYIPGEELDGFIQRIKTKHSNLLVKITQTRVKGKITLEVKGGLENSTTTIRSLIKKLEG